MIRHAEDDPLSVFMLDVLDGNTVTDDITGSKSNDNNANVIIKAIQTMYRLDLESLKETVVLGFYNNQNYAVIDRLRQWAATLDDVPGLNPTIGELGFRVVDLSPTEKPSKTSIEDLGLKVVNTNGSQGGEANYVFLDLTVTDKLGSVAEDNRYLVAATRARQFLCIVGSSSLFKKKLKSRKTSSDEGDRENTRVPLINQYIWELINGDVLFPITGAKFGDETFGKPFSPGHGWKDSAWDASVPATHSGKGKEKATESGEGPNAVVSEEQVGQGEGKARGWWRRLVRLGGG